jgi:hypothetical protein
VINEKADLLEVALPGRLGKGSAQQGDAARRRGIRREAVAQQNFETGP